MLQHTSTKHLLELKSILEQLNETDYNRALPTLNNGTLGRHVRHILEFYECLFLSDASDTICYDDRKRNLILEENIAIASEYVDTIIAKIAGVYDNKFLLLKSRFGSEEITMDSSLHREIIYNIEHTVHHLAIIRIALSVECKYISLSSNFGYADSTIQFLQSQKVSA